MAKHIDINGSSARGISFGANTSRSARLGGSSGVPRYVGAEAEVTRVDNGVRIWLKDYRGTTEEVVYEAIQQVEFNEDSSLTIELPDGRTFTSEPLKGEKGDKGDKGESAPIYFATTAEWAEQTSLISEKDAFYIWTDYKEYNGQYIPGMKIGDGLAYVIDLPFMDELLQAHIANTEIHITDEERAFWNAKNRSMVVGETLILTEQ